MKKLPTIDLNEKDVTLTEFVKRIRVAVDARCPDATFRTWVRTTLGVTYVQESERSES